MHQCKGRGGRASILERGHARLSSPGRDGGTSPSERGGVDQRKSRCMTQKQTWAQVPKWPPTWNGCSFGLEWGRNETGSLVLLKFGFYPEATRRHWRILFTWVLDRFAVLKDPRGGHVDSAQQEAGRPVRGMFNFCFGEGAEVMLRKWVVFARTLFSTGSLREL